LTDNAILTAAYTFTDRFETGKKMVDSARKKYKEFQFKLLGHSRGSLFFNNLCSKTDKY
jgi:hypothetical protein